MRTREGHGIEVVHHTDTPPAGPVPSPRASRGPGTVVAALVAAALAVAALALLALLVARGGGEVTTMSNTPAVQPGPPQPIELSVQAPAAIIAGQAADFTVSWSDGSGIFSGASEDWGEGLGASSRKQGQCDPTAAAPQASEGTYTASHTWEAPGTYTVAFSVASYVCTDGVAVEETATQQVSVEVSPPR